jgi:hypothetical protein
MIYVAAFAPGAGEAAGGLMEKFPAPPLAAALVPDAAGFLFINRTQFQEVFAPDPSAEEAAVLGAAQKPIAASIFGKAVKAAAWKTIPSWYVVSKQDRAINPEVGVSWRKEQKPRLQKFRAAMWLIYPSRNSLSELSKRPRSPRRNKI